MRAPDIRRTFLEFFRERDHRVVPSSSLVPDDPTLLLTTAGMVQFKPFFLGQRTPENSRAASVQKCARTTDIENVGLNARNLTFFEMLGNFSFGDYFKPEACAWAWDLVTGGFGLESDRLWVTVFESDTEAAEVWRDGVGVPAERIVRRGREDNFWWMGVPGPCGPCSEIFYDRGPAYGDVDGFEDGDRIMEIWNLVFMESLCDDKGQIVGELERRNIDTGMGLERMCLILQGADSVYETDLIRPMLACAEELAGRRYGDDPKADMSLRVMTEHARAASFLAADGVFPSNEDRGYVLRRLIRRAVRHARLLGIDGAVMPPLVARVAETIGDAYPELRTDRAFIEQVAGQEEEHFRGTLRQGLAMLEDEVTQARQAGARGVSGAAAFRLHDTYGFPLDLTVEIAAEAGFEVDRSEFARLMDEQRRRARDARRETGEVAGIEALRGVLAKAGPSLFLGYEQDEVETTIVGLVGESGERAPSARAGDRVEVVLAATPFYPEGGGQVGDAGRIRTPAGELDVIDTRRLFDDLIVHRARVAEGEVAEGLAVVAAVDRDRRAATMRSHTATHLLHWALRDALGPHARQMGSLVTAGRLRFDFPHFEAVPGEILEQVEEIVNARLVADDPVRPYETTMDEARTRGAIMLFEEKYGEIVRVVEIGDYSVELCGGTHVTHTSQVGAVRILGEGSIGANLRRVEALTGGEAFEAGRRERFLLQEVAALLKSTPEEVPDGIRRLLERLKEAEDKLRRARGAAQREQAAELAARAQPVGQARFLAAEIAGLAVSDLQTLATAVREAIGEGAAVVLASGTDGRAGIVAAVDRQLTGRGVSARALIAGAAKAIGGGAGGKDDLATGGGRRPEALAEALRVAEETARDILA